MGFTAADWCSCQRVFLRHRFPGSVAEEAKITARKIPDGSGRFMLLI
jgi:hypothetical protein